LGGERQKSNVGFEVLTAAVINVAIFRDIEPCNPHVFSCLAEDGSEMSFNLLETKRFLNTI
jgi:hypothetical protein